jgi:hypothetical protein
MLSVAVAGALAITSASAWESPLKRKYLTKPLQICDQGVFYVGGTPKLTQFGLGPTPAETTQIIIGSMYVEFQVPMVSKAWPLIMVHGSGYNGSCVRGTAGGSEGWADYTVRHGIPTFVVDQAGRARSGFDKSVIHEGEWLIANGAPGAAASLIPTIGGSTSTAWTSWFGHIVPAVPPSVGDITVGDMVRHGAPALQSDGLPAPGQDPDCAAEPGHCTQLGRIPMEPEAPWAVDQAIKARIGAGVGLGTVVPDNAKILDNASYLALDAYKFNVPNTEATLPGEFCQSCTTQNLPSTQVWTPKALAELVAGLEGGVIATHSQSGIMGHQAVRYLKQNGKLHLLKGLMTLEGSCDLAQAGLTPADFADNNIPYLAFFSDTFTVGTGNNLPVCQASVDAIKAAGGKADLIHLTQPGWWQGSYAGPWGPDYVGPFLNVSHMMMIESNPAPDGRATNLQVMDVLLKWADENISKPKTTTCNQANAGPPQGVPPGPPNGVPPGPPAGKGKNS